MVNLLPEQEQRIITTRYYLHLGAFFFFALGTVLLIGTILLIPSYLTARASADSYERYRDALEGSVGLKERNQAGDTAVRLHELVRIADSYAEGAFTSDLIDALGAKITSGISVTALSFARSEQGAAVVIEGKATSRQKLLAFVEALRESSSFVEVSLPVSQLVAEENAGFSIEALYEKQ